MVPGRIKEAGGDTAYCSLWFFLRPLGATALLTEEATIAPRISAIVTIPMAAISTLGAFSTKSVTANCGIEGSAKDPNLGG